MRLSLQSFHAAAFRLSGWRSILAALFVLVISRASRALSMPDALSAPSGPLSSTSSCERSRPLVFFWADFAFLGADRPGVFFSSSASSASRSAFFFASSSFLAASASLVAMTTC